MAKPTEHLIVFLTASEAHGGRRMSAREIVENFRGLDRRYIFQRLAEIGAALSNREQAQGTEGERITSQFLLLLSQRPLWPYRDVGIALLKTMAQGLSGTGPKRLLWHEKVVYLMQALALAEGTANGSRPEDWYLAWLALNVNDYATTWSVSSPELSREDELVAEFLHLGRFNTNLDPVRETVRGELLLTRAVPHHPDYNTKEKWEALQRRAFDGNLYSEYVDRFLGPLAMEAETWMQDPKPATPVVSRYKWSMNMEGGAEPGERFLASLTIDADKAKESLGQLPPGGEVIRFPRFIYRTPLVAFGSEEGLIPASPWVLEHQLAFGFWGRLLNALKVERGANPGMKTWTGMFGGLFERYCRWLAKEARESPRYPPGSTLLPSTMGTSDEIEDIVFATPDRAVLFSCKARLMREEDVRAATSPGALLKWLESFFFEEEHREQRGGAFRLLDEKVQHIRQGAYEPRINRSARISPVVVTYDRPGDTLMISRWFRRRLEAEGLLQQSETELPLVLSIDSFEILMGMAAHGVSIFTVLDLCRQEEAGASIFKSTIRDHFPDDVRQRLPSLLAEFSRLTDRIKSRFTKREPV